MPTSKDVNDLYQKYLKLRGSRTKSKRDINRILRPKQKATVHTFRKRVLEWQRKQKEKLELEEKQRRKEHLKEKKKKKRIRREYEEVTGLSVPRKRKKKKLSDQERYKRLMRKLQFRELSPEDYELLQKLDTLAGVTQKTTPTQVLKQCIQIATIDDVKSGDHDERCPICFADYIITNEDGEEELERPVCILKKCQHLFHRDCIETWLKNNSTKCPLCNVSMMPKGD